MAAYICPSLHFFFKGLLYCYPPKLIDSHQQMLVDAGDPLFTSDNLWFLDTQRKSEQTSAVTKNVGVPVRAVF